MKWCKTIKRDNLLKNTHIPKIERKLWTFCNAILRKNRFRTRQKCSPEASRIEDHLSVFSFHKRSIYDENGGWFPVVAPEEIQVNFASNDVKFQVKYPSAPQTQTTLAMSLKLVLA